MADKKEIRIDIKARNLATRGFQEAGNAAKNFGQRMQKINQVVAFLGITGGLRIVTGLIRDTINATAEQEAAEARLAQVLKATGNAAGFSADQLANRAVALAKGTQFADEAIISAQATLATFTQISGKTFDRAIRAAADMSVIFGQDLKSSIVQIGKALNDPARGITALQRVGVVFSVTQREQIRNLVEQNDLLGAQAVILDELKVEFGGVAEAQGKTLAGGVAQLKNAIVDLLEVMGRATAGGGGESAFARWAQGLQQINMALDTFNRKSEDAAGATGWVDKLGAAMPGPEGGPLTALGGWLGDIATRGTVGVGPLEDVTALLAGGGPTEAQAAAQAQAAKRTAEINALLKDGRLILLDEELKKVDEINRKERERRELFSHNLDRLRDQLRAQLEAGGVTPGQSAELEARISGIDRVQAQQEKEAAEKDAKEQAKTDAKAAKDQTRADEKAAKEQAREKIRLADSLRQLDSQIRQAQLEAQGRTLGAELEQIRANYAERIRAATNLAEKEKLARLGALEGEAAARASTEDDRTVKAANRRAVAGLAISSRFTGLAARFEASGTDPVKTTNEKLEKANQLAQKNRLLLEQVARNTDPENSQAINLSLT